MNMALLFSSLALLAAAALDIGANLFLAKSDGFRRKVFGFAALGMVCLAYYCLSLAVRQMDLAVAYALWGAFGILGTSLGGWLFFGQKIRPIAWLGIFMLLLGSSILQLS